MTHRPVGTGRLGDQTYPVRPSRWRSVNASSGRLPGKLQAADEKEEQHLAFSERGRRVRTQCPFWCKQFCSAFHKIFFFVILAKFLVITDVIFLFKIRSQYTWFSLFWLCTEVQKSQPLSPFITSKFPHPTLLCLQLAEWESSVHVGSLLTMFTWPCQQRPPKVIKYAACFPTWPNFQGE